ncbi:hypothetical protein [Streptomyces lanatus]|uniref:Uncharacterized protein n=1 Tax=Streptomyces lanatus TaxID=66900 RepID=A0ABV1XI50_9ACTN|nr:hypothetical protein [Streptomyces lanatus]GHG93329.1 hypothetical protein GCM10018780_15700 [Streptomyces lanatus]
MTAENQSRGADALMAAISGEPLTDEARADASFMAEHRAAEADLALLREQLGIIGHALAEPEAPKPAPIPVRQPTRRRLLPLALAATAASVLVGMGWLVVQAGSGANSDAGASSAADEAAPQSGGTVFGSPSYLACSRLVAEGTATAVEQLPGTESIRVTLHMTRYYKPDKEGEQELTYVVDRNLVPGLRKGDPVLIGILDGARQPDFWAVGERDIAPERAWITASLPEARELGC